MSGRQSVIQVHPTRHCNLQCLHCYSLSGPDAREEIDVATLSAAVTDAAAVGYEVMGVSGGEPLLYSGLRPLLAHATKLGMRTTVTTNGMLLDRRGLAMLEGVTSILAISLDGTPSSHNRMRDSAAAFDKMQSHLDGVRQSGIPFGFIFTLTQFNLDELLWVTSFAVQAGAGLLQIHPLEITGRAESRLSGARPDHVEALVAYGEIVRKKLEVGDRLAIQFDFAPTRLLRDSPECVLAGSAEPAVRMSEAVPSIVIEPDGEVVPLEFGFSRAYSFGNLREGPLHALLSRWRIDREADFRQLCRDVHADCTSPDAPAIVNWYEAIHARGLAS